MKPYLIALVALGVAFAGSGCSNAHAAAANRGRPNILVVLADDLGFSDLGCYGSEIATPTLDRLASEGLRFSQFYNTAKCHSSRVSLLTGRYCIQAGDVEMGHAVTIPEVLAPAGYFTAISGKWHLAHQPTDYGFHRAFGHLSGQTSYYKGDNTFRLNGQRWQVPVQGFYTTVADVDFAIRFVNEARQEKKPWFLYLAFNAPHAPLQPLKADYERYLGKYDAGWDVMRAARVAKLKQLGVLGKDFQESPRPEHIPAWTALSPEFRNWEARRMAAYAALIDRLDREIGRLVQNLEQAGDMDNTLILFVSDNGACPYDRNSVGRDRQPYEGTTLWSDSTGWAWARNTPFRYYKQNQFEGGIATPAIVHWPAGLKTKPGSIVDTPAHLVDLLPTFAEIGGAKIPSEFPGRTPTPLAGISIAKVLRGEPLGDRPPLHLLFGRDRGLRMGEWKLVDFQSGPWELYNLKQDRTELHNLAAEHPDIVQRMAAQWFDMAENVLHVPANGRGPVSAVAEKVHREWTVYGSLDPRNARHQRAKQQPAAKRQSASGPQVRARVGTKLTIAEDELHLTCTGDDPGLVLGGLDGSENGPYTVDFRLQSNARGEGEIFWTTDADTPPNRGEHVSFAPTHDGSWQHISVAIPDAKPLFTLRLDPCDGRGEVKIANLRLVDSAGRTLKTWP